MSAVTEPCQQLVLLTQLFAEDKTLTESISAMTKEPGTQTQVVDTQNMNSDDWDKLLSLILSTPKVITL